MTAELAPDREAIQQFVSALFKHADKQGFVSLRIFPDKGAKNDKPIEIDDIRIGDPRFLDVAFNRANQAAYWHEPAVFCPPVATFRTAGSAAGANLHEGVALSVECDQHPQEARQTLEAILGEPTLVVVSGGEWTNPETGEIELRVHLHWRLNKPTSTKAEHALLREARDLATDLVGGDTSNKSIVHPIRWPGSWHRKGTPRLAKIVASSDREIDRVEAIRHLRDASGSVAFGANKLGKPPRGGTLLAAFPKEPGPPLAAAPAAVAAALAVIPNDDLEWDDWTYIALAIYGATDGSEVGREAFATWSAKSSKNDPEATETRWRHFKRSPPTKIGFGTLVHLARKYSPGWCYPAEAGVDPVDLWAKFDPPTIPRGVLPEVIEQFAFDRGMAMGGDICGIAAGALAVCAAAIPDKIQLKVKRYDDGWKESARLWVTLVGPVSTMKSPIMSAVVKPLRRIDTDMARENARKMAEYKKLDAEERKQEDVPKQPRLMLQDTTMEAAQETLKDSPDGVLCFQDELSGWFGSMDKYSGGKGSAKDRAFWLESYNGAPYSVNRVGRGTTFIDNLSVSILGGIQPEPIRALAEGSHDDGLLQRLVPIVLRPAVVGRDETPSSVVSDYDELIGKLHRLRPPTTGGIFLAPTNLTFDDGALEIRKGLEKKHLELQQCESLHRKLASHIGKYNGIFARLCVVWHCIENAGGELPAVITEHTARRVACFLHDFLLPHALAFYAGTLGLSNDHDALTAIAGYILARKSERIAYRDCMRGDTVMKKLMPREAEMVFEQLDGFGWVTKTAGQNPTDRPRWIVNSVVHQKFAERGKAEAERRERDRATISSLCRIRAA
jgi:hypothetical protein